MIEINLYFAADANQLSGFALQISSCKISLGEVAEWPKAAVLKTVVPVTVPWVRILPSPLIKKERLAETCKPFLFGVSLDDLMK